jgi:DNA invertase Pin-like site-specific DNA recombinase
MSWLVMSEIGYIRVSTVEQNTARQLADVLLDKTFEDKCSGGAKNRPELNELIDYMRSGDVVHVHSIDRLARNTQNLLELVDLFKAKGVTLKFHKESMVFTPSGKDSMQELMLTVMGAVAQFERAMIRERIAEGIVKAKAAGVYSKPRKKKVDAAEVLRLLAEGLSQAEIARRLGCNSRTVLRIKQSENSA